MPTANAPTASVFRHAESRRQRPRPPAPRPRGARRAASCALPHRPEGRGTCRRRSPQVRRPCSHYSLPARCRPLASLHVSDLHAGTHEEPEVEADLARSYGETDPEARRRRRGDLTHRNTRGAADPRGARSCARSNGPLVVVPGNHDIPPWPPARFTRRSRSSGASGRRSSRSTAPNAWSCAGSTRSGPGSTREARCGASSSSGLPRILADAPAGALRVVALHHHLMGAPWRSRKRPIANRSSVLGALVDAGAELVVSGHVHQSAVGERREFEVVHEARCPARPS